LTAHMTNQMYDLPKDGSSWQDAVQRCVILTAHMTNT